VIGVRPTTVLAAAAVSAPALWQAYEGTLPVTTALLRFVIAVPVAALAFGLLRALVGTGSRTPKRRVADSEAHDRGSAAGRGN